ncbi:MAG: BON domain-containing protein [Ottowia sp.]
MPFATAPPRWRARSPPCWAAARAARPGAPRRGRSRCHRCRGWRHLPAHAEAGTTAGAQRIAERVRAALAAEPRLAGAALGVEGFEGGVMVLSGRLPSAADRALALHTARRVAGVGDVVDRMSAP